MVAQLGQLEKYSVCSEMHDIWAVQLVCDATALPGVANCRQREYKISSPASAFMRCLVVVQDDGWAVLCALTQKTQDMNQITGTGVYISCLHLHSLFFPPTPPFSFLPIWNTPPASWTISTSRDLHRTMPLVPKHSQSPTQLCTLTLSFLPLPSTVSYC